MSELRLWLRPEARRQTLEALAEELGAVRSVEDARSHEGFTRVAWQLGEGALGWTEDHTFGVRLAWASGDEARCETLCEALRARLPAWTSEQLHALASSEDARVALPALRVLARAEPGGVDEALVEAIAPLLGHPDEVVVRATCRVIHAGSWKALAPVIRARIAQAPALSGLLLALLQALDAE